MKRTDLDRLHGHPTPWWSRYALEHPTVVRRTLSMREADDHRWSGAVLNGALGALGLLFVLGTLWGLAIAPGLRARGDHPWLDACALTLVLLPTGGYAVVVRLRRAYGSTMAAIHRHHPDAFVQIAAAWEREREARELRRTIAAVPPAPSEPTGARPRRRL